MSPATPTERQPLLMYHSPTGSDSSGGTSLPPDDIANNISIGRHSTRSPSQDSNMSNISTIIAPPSQIPAEEKDAAQSDKKLDRGKLIRDAIIGFSDGLTVPFALTAGLSSLGSTRIVIIGGLAELFAGSISMGLGAYLAAATEAKHYDVQKIQQRKAIHQSCEQREERIYAIFDGYGIDRDQCAGVVAGLKANPEAWVRFTMDIEMKLERESTAFACLEGFVMGMAYFFGGLLPMIPYFALMGNVMSAFFISIGITILILLVFGFSKAKFTGNNFRDCCVSALQTLIVGVVAAGVSYGIVKGVNQIERPT